MSDKKYNGWKNYETWVTALWIDNDYSSYLIRCGMVDEIKEESECEIRRTNLLAANLREWIESLNPLAQEASLFTDLLNAALQEVDWHEIADNFLEE